MLVTAVTRFLAGGARRRGKFRGHQWAQFGPCLRLGCAGLVREPTARTYRRGRQTSGARSTRRLCCAPRKARRGLPGADSQLMLIVLPRREDEMSEARVTMAELLTVALAMAPIGAVHAELVQNDA